MFNGETNDASNYYIIRVRVSYYIIHTVIGETYVRVLIGLLPEHPRRLWTNRQDDTKATPARASLVATKSAGSPK